MDCRNVFSLAVLAAALAVPASARSQATLTPLIGGYVPAGDLTQVRDGAENVATTRNGVLSLGLNLDVGPLRGTMAYASGTTIKNANRQDIGKGTVLGIAGDLVVRPLPRLFVQPYVLLGAGQKFYKFDETAPASSFGDTRRFAWHGGIGADLSVGSLGVVAELTDFLSKDTDSKWSNHDAFLMLGLRLRLP
jgi:hypothetical protein